MGNIIRNIKSKWASIPPIEKVKIMIKQLMVLKIAEIEWFEKPRAKNLFYSHQWSITINHVLIRDYFFSFFYLNFLVHPFNRTHFIIFDRVATRRLCIAVA